MQRTASILLVATVSFAIFTTSGTSAQAVAQGKPAAVESASSKVIDGVTYYYDANGNPLYKDDPVHYTPARRFFYRNGGWVMARIGNGHHRSRYANTGLHKRRGTAGQSAQPGSGTQFRKQVERRGQSGTTQAGQNAAGGKQAGKDVRAGRQGGKRAQSANSGLAQGARTSKAGRDAASDKTGRATDSGQTGSGNKYGAGAASGGRSGNAGKSGSSARGGGRSGAGSKSASSTARGGGNGGKSAGSAGRGGRRGPK
ncbi:MAG: hypothetical protein AMXMBFR47_43910 [Planctomycetota bacterium]